MMRIICLKKYVRTCNDMWIASSDSYLFIVDDDSGTESFDSQLTAEANW